MNCKHHHFTDDESQIVSQWLAHKSDCWHRQQMSYSQDFADSLIQTIQINQMAARRLLFMWCSNCEEITQYEAVNFVRIVEYCIHSCFHWYINYENSPQNTKLIENKVIHIYGLHCVWYNINAQYEPLPCLWLGTLPLVRWHGPTGCVWAAGCLAEVGCRWLEALYSLIVLMCR